MRATEAIATSGPLASGLGSVIYPQSGKLPSQMTDDEIDAHVRATLEMRPALLLPPSNLPSHHLPSRRLIANGP